MSIDPVDAAVAELEREVTSRLAEPRGYAVLALCSAERVGDFYRVFSSRANWGNNSELIHVRTVLWEHLAQERRAELRTLRQALAITERVAPHADDFTEIPETLLAQCSCAALGLAVRWCISPRTVRPRLSASIVLETLAALECLRETGCYELGSGHHARRFRMAVLTRGWVAAERAHVLDDLKLLCRDSLPWTRRIGALRCHSVSSRYVLQDPL